MSAHPETASLVSVPHVLQGEVVTGSANVYGPSGAQFATPRLDLDRLVWPRSEPGPAFDVPLAEIMDVLVNWLPQHIVKMDKQYGPHAH